VFDDIEVERAGVVDESDLAELAAGGLPAGL